jgi:tight adherence protein B
MDILVLLISILIVMVIMGMAIAFIMTQESEKKKRALSIIKGKDVEGRNSADALSLSQDKRREAIAQKLKDNDTGDGKNKKKATMKLMLLQAGMTTTVRKYWIGSLIFAIVFTAVIHLIGQPPFIVIMSFIIGLLGLPKIFLKRKIKKRQQKFLKEFGDALESMVRLLKAGMPISEAIKMAGREYEGPVGEEMLKIYEAQKIGIPMPEATLEAAERMPITEMQMFATGIAIQAQTGSSLSEVLTNLANVIRARFRLRRKVQALSAEAKASAMIIGSLPFLVGGGLFLINPEYIQILFEQTTGKIMIAMSAVWMGMGVMVMKIMINFRI